MKNSIITEIKKTFFDKYVDKNIKPNQIDAKGYHSELHKSWIKFYCNIE